jgi:hypothetical protein
MGQILRGVWVCFWRDSGSPRRSWAAGRGQIWHSAARKSGASLSGQAPLKMPCTPVSGSTMVTVGENLAHGETAESEPVELTLPTSPPINP